MNSETNSGRSLRETEQEVEAEGRKWIHQRLQKKLQAEADGLGFVFPLGGSQAKHRRKETMPRVRPSDESNLKCGGEEIPLMELGHTHLPVVGLSAHQQLSPALEDKLAYFVTVTGEYETAVQLSLKVGIRMDDATLPRSPAAGARAQEQPRARLLQTPAEKAPERASSELGVLMLDGFLVRHRGLAGAGKKRSNPAWNGMNKRSVCSIATNNPSRANWRRKSL